MSLHKGSGNAHEVAVNPFFLGAADPVGSMNTAPPKHRLADGPMTPSAAYQLIHDELLLDGSARLNLATFVTTWMEPQARVLMAECVDKNMIDKDEYPQTAELERRCVGDPGRPVARPRPRAGDRLLDDRIERGVHARRDGAASGAGPARVQRPHRAGPTW